MVLKKKLRMNDLLNSLTNRVSQLEKEINELKLRIYRENVYNTIGVNHENARGSRESTNKSLSTFPGSENEYEYEGEQRAKKSPPLYEIPYLQRERSTSQGILRKSSSSPEYVKGNLLRGKPKSKKKK
jgi:hypothetical protein